MVTTLAKKKQEAPLSTLGTLQEEINRLFDAAFGNEAPSSAATMFPTIDVAEDSDNVYVEADIPGFEQKDINVSVTADSLTLAATRTAEREESRRDFHRTERFRGGFYREIGLPSPVDTSRVKASYADGVLKVTLPREREVKGREIKVNVG